MGKAKTANRGTQAPKLPAKPKVITLRLPRNYEATVDGYVIKEGK